MGCKTVFRCYRDLGGNRSKFSEVSVQKYLESFLEKNSEKGFQTHPTQSHSDALPASEPGPHSPCPQPLALPTPGKHIDLCKNSLGRVMGFQGLLSECPWQAADLKGRC